MSNLRCSVRSRLHKADGPSTFSGGASSGAALVKSHQKSPTSLLHILPPSSQFHPMKSLSIERPRSPRRSQSISTPAESAASTPFASAPSSPRQFFYYSAPSSPRGRSSRKLEFEDDHGLAVPFAWEEKPGTPKRQQKTNFSASSPSSPTSTDYGTGFYLSAPVSPQPGIVYQPEDEFEFTSARMSEADSVGSFMSHADELFFKGQLLPLKLPPRLQQQQQQQRERTDVSLSSKFVQQFQSPRSARSPRMTAARKESKVHQRAHSLFFSYEDEKKPASFVPIAPTPKAKKSLKELLHLSTQKKQSRSSSVSSAGSSGTSRYSSSRSSSTSSNKSSSRNSVSSRQVNPISPGELLHYRRFASKNVEELRKKMLMPYKQGLLGWLGCLPARKQEV